MALDTIARNRQRVLGHGGVGFPTLAALMAAASQQRARSHEVTADTRGVLFVDDGGRLGVDFGGQGCESLTPWALRQVGGIAGVPASVLERVKPDTAARVLNETLPREEVDGGGPRTWLLERTGEGEERTLRAVTSTGYRRLWDSDLYGEVERWLSPAGWLPAFPERNAFEAEEKRERALWRSDRDTFAFFMSPRAPEGGDDGLGGLRRGLYIGNSETGGRSLLWGTFWFREMCANFLVWDVQQVQHSRRRRHTAGVTGEAQALRSWIMNAEQVIREQDLAPFRALQAYPFPMLDPKQGETWTEQAARTLAERHGFTRSVAGFAAEYAAEGRDGTARGSRWAVVNGVTAAAKGRTPGDRFDLSQEAGALAGALLAT
jgi:hypothetical protein